MKNKEYFKDQIYDILCSYKSVAVNRKTGEPFMCDGSSCANCALFRSDGTCKTCAFMNWLDQEHIEHVLTHEEKQYLENVIRPFKDRVKFIRKDYTTGVNASICVDVYLYSNIEYTDTFSLPFFDVTKMYTGMEKNKCYTLEELGLFADEEEDGEKK